MMIRLKEDMLEDDMKDSNHNTDTESKIEEVDSSMIYSKKISDKRAMMVPSRSPETTAFQCWKLSIVNIF
jgi:hypothetical protein